MIYNTVIAFDPPMHYDTILYIIYVTVRAKPSLVNTSDFAWLMTCKTFLGCYTEFKFSLSNDKAMSSLLLL